MHPCWPTQLTSGRLVLRPFTVRDVPAFHQVILENEAHLRPWMLWTAHEPVPIEERYALVERWAAQVGKGTEWQGGMFLDGEIVGWAGLRPRGSPETMEIGYWVHRGFTRRGLATVTSYLLTCLAFERPSTRAVLIMHDRANLASRGIPARLGYQLTGEEPGDPDGRSPGEEGIDCLWTVTRTAWSEVLERGPAPTVKD
jgi:ribosomal-protein-serine acetyltransferase